MQSPQQACALKSSSPVSLPERADLKDKETCCRQPANTQFVSRRGPIGGRAAAILQPPADLVRWLRQLVPSGSCRAEYPMG
jgi:hypothetical protein